MTSSVVLTFLVLMSGNPTPAPDANTAEKRLRYLAAKLDAMVEIKEKENTLSLQLTELGDQVRTPEDKQKPDAFDKNVTLTLDLLGIAEIFNGKFEPEVFQIKFSKPMRMSLRTALEKIGEQIDAGVVVRPDCIELVRCDKIRKELNCPFATSQELRRLVVSVFEKVPLETALKELERTHNRNIVVSPLAEKMMAQPITARLVNVPFDTAVDVLAELADLKVVHKANVFFVTTKEQAATLIEEEKKRLIEEKKRYEEQKPKEPN